MMSDLTPSSTNLREIRERKMAMRWRDGNMANIQIKPLNIPNMDDWLKLSTDRISVQSKPLPGHGVREDTSRVSLRKLGGGREI